MCFWSDIMVVVPWCNSLSEFAEAICRGDDDSRGKHCAWAQFWRDVLCKDDGHHAGLSELKELTGKATDALSQWANSLGGITKAARLEAPLPGVLVRSSIKASSPRGPSLCPEAADAYACRVRNGVCVEALVFGSLGIFTICEESLKLVCGAPADPALLDHVLAVCAKVCSIVGQIPVSFLSFANIRRLLDWLYWAAEVSLDTVGGSLDAWLDSQWPMFVQALATTLASILETKKCAVHADEISGPVLACIRSRDLCKTSTQFALATALGFHHLPVAATLLMLFRFGWTPCWTSCWTSSTRPLCNRCAGQDLSPPRDKMASWKLRSAPFVTEPEGPVPALVQVVEPAGPSGVGQGLPLRKFLPSRAVLAAGIGAIGAGGYSLATLVEEGKTTGEALALSLSLAASAPSPVPARVPQLLTQLTESRDVVYCSESGSGSGLGSGSTTSVRRTSCQDKWGPGSPFDDKVVRWKAIVVAFFGPADTFLKNLNILQGDPLCGHRFQRCEWRERTDRVHGTVSHRDEIDALATAVADCMCDVYTRRCAV